MKSTTISAKYCDLVNLRYILERKNRDICPRTFQSKDGWSIWCKKVKYIPFFQSFGSGRIRIISPDHGQYTEKLRRKKLEFVRLSDPDQNDTDPKHCFFYYVLVMWIRFILICIRYFTKRIWILEMKRI